MRNDIENIFKILPFGTDIKYNIYNQMSKHVFSISPLLKQDLQTFFLLNQVIRTYQAELETDYMDQNYFLYSLYNDLVHEHHQNIINEYNDSDSLFHNYYYEAILRETMLPPTSICRYPFLTKRIKYFWILLNPMQRLNFMKFIEIKFN